jgi:hypothetical protein
MDLVLRKLHPNARFGRRVGTTSNFKPEWRSSTHRISDEEVDRKCSPQAKHSSMLYFDIKREPLDVPFDLSYEVTYWNAHNGPKGDWHAVFVGHPTKELLIKVIFPRSKTYSSYVLKSLDGIDCDAVHLPYPDPIVHEGVDERTGAKAITWTIASPKLYSTYRIDWEWGKSANYDTP